jgi:Cu(I)/Ag(I) efflux system membrane fusion protein
MQKSKSGSVSKGFLYRLPKYWDTIKITFINPRLIPTRLLLIRIVPNTNLSLKPGMQAVAQLTQSNLKGLIPIDAVIRDENATYIWVEKAMVCMKM